MPSIFLWAMPIAEVLRPFRPWIFYPLQVKRELRHCPLKIFIKPIKALKGRNILTLGIALRKHLTQSLPRNSTPCPRYNHNNADRALSIGFLTLKGQNP